LSWVFPPIAAHAAARHFRRGPRWLRAATIALTMPDLLAGPVMDP
jgi:hypothetical protein